MDSSRGSLRKRVHGALVVAGIVAVTAIAASAELPRGPMLAANEAVSDGEFADSVFLPPDRKTLQRLAQARELLVQQRYGEAVRYLGSILDGPEDYFFQPDKNVPVHRSLKAVSQRLIGSLPRKGRELYQLQYGPRSRQMLSDAIAAGDMARLAEVSRRFFHTQAGREATLLLGLHHLDHSRPLAGALMLRRLKDALGDETRFEPALSLAMATGWLRAGNREDARQTLIRLKTESKQATVELAGRRVPLFADDADALAWLDRFGEFGRLSELAEAELWAMVGGNPARNAASFGDAPLLNICWNIPTGNDDLSLMSNLSQLQRESLRQGIPTLSALHPLAVDDMILMRTACNLVAIDFATGKREWQVAVEDELEAFLQDCKNAETASSKQALAAWLRQRVWGDSTYGSLSSDGQCVFTIEGSGINLKQSPYSHRVIRTATTDPKPHNRLSAHDIRTGKLRWHLGGPNDQFALRMAETFFLGPPLPMMGRLYVLGEIEGEVRLLALDAKSGDLVWSQQLAIPRDDLLRHPLRRVAGLSPSYADGILVCPTSAGAVVAVDLATRSLLWGYRYGGQSESTARMNRLQIQMRWMGFAGSSSTDRWSNANPMLANGRVLITPLESNSVHCLDLRDGRLLWKLDRNDDLYVACVDRQKVIVVGRHAVRAVSLFETEEQSRTIRVVERVGLEQKIVERQQVVTVPKAAWNGRTVELPDGCMPSGRGFLHEGKYFLPVDSARVVAIDLDLGKIVHVSESRDGTVPGNLICYKNRVISQSGKSLDVFYELESARNETDRRLAAEPDNAADLALRGAVLFDDGEYARAVASLRRAYELDANPQTRDLLRDAMLDGLRTEFQTLHDLFVGSEKGGIEQLLDEQLLDEPGPQAEVARATFLRLMATGLHESGEWAEALEYYLTLADWDDGTSPLQSLSRTHSTRRDLWVREHIGRLRDDAGKEAKQQIDDAVELRRHAALETDGVDGIERFLATFGNHPSADEARRQFVRRLVASDRMLAAEMVLCGEQQSTDPSTAAAATAELGTLLRTAQRPRDAAACYDRLRQEFALVVCKDGKTGEQLVAGLPEDGPVRQAMRGDAPWPRGHVEVKRDLLTTTPPSNIILGMNTLRGTTPGRYPLAYQGKVGPFFTDLTIRFDQARSLLLAIDGYGRETFGPVSLIEDNSPRSRVFSSPDMAHGRVAGHLLLVSIGHRIVAVDTLGNGDGGNGDGAAAKMLWSVDLSDFDALDEGLGGAGEGQENEPVLPRIQTSRYFSPEMGSLGPVSSRRVILQRYRCLIALDPLTGRPLWVRRNVTPGSTLFGDDRFLFVLPPGRKEALVFQMSDGHLLGKRPIPQCEPLSPSLDERLRLALGGMQGWGMQGRWLGNNFASTGSTPFERTCLATLGRRMLVWHKEDDHAVLELFDPWEQRSVWPPRKFSLEAKVAIAGPEAVGVFEPDGSFTLLSMDDGRTMTEIQLKPEEALAEIFLVRLGEQYFLTTNNRRTKAQDLVSARLVPDRMPGTLYKAVASGRVYAFNLSGQLMWDEPAEIENQHFLLNQPARLPLLTFACKPYRKTANSSGGPKAALLCLDRRTGRKVFEDLGSNAPGNLFSIEGDPEKKTIVLHTGREEITLTLTDKPIVPLPEKTAASSGERVGGALLKAFGKALAEPAGGTRKDR